MNSRDELTPKQQVQAMLRRLPGDVSYDEIQYHIFVIQRVQDGLDAIDRREPTLMTEQVKQLLAKSGRRWTVGGPRIGGTKGSRNATRRPGR